MAHKLVKFLQDHLLWNDLSPDDRKVIAGFIPSKDQEVIRTIDGKDPKTILDGLFSYIDNSLKEKSGSIKADQSEQVIPQAATTRPVDNITGKEIVTRSSRKPMSVPPLLELTPKELSDRRADTHRKLAHLVSNKIAYATGSIDGVVDGVANGIAELEEDVVFLLSKMTYGAIHGWKRGKYPVSQDQ